jgi:hypothetical protein
MERNDAGAFLTDPFCQFLHLKHGNTLHFDLNAIFHQADVVTLIVTFFQILDWFARKICALEAIGMAFLVGAVFNLARFAAFRFMQIVAKAAIAGFLDLQMNITNHAIHPTWSKQVSRNNRRHFHALTSFGRITFLASLSAQT